VHTQCEQFNLTTTVREVENGGPARKMSSLKRSFKVKQKCECRIKQKENIRIDRQGKYVEREKRKTERRQGNAKAIANAFRNF